MKGIRRKEKAITDLAVMDDIIRSSQFITIAMSDENEPYLVTLSHGYDAKNKCIYFHCAKEGKKLDIKQLNEEDPGMLEAIYQEIDDFNSFDKEKVKKSHGSS